MVFDPKTFKPLPEPQQARVVPVPVSSLDQAREDKLRNTPIPQLKQYRPATPEEAARYGYKTGEIEKGSKKFQPLKGVPLGAKEQDILNNSQQVVEAAAQTAEQLQRAFQLNDQAYSGGMPKVRMAMGRLIGSDDPAYVASEELDNLMGRLALSQLKSTFPGAISDGERKVLTELQGSMSLPRAVRDRIYRNAIPVLQNVIQRNSNRINQIKGGYYSTRDVPASPGKPSPIK